jgi:hypothetical protein
MKRTRSIAIVGHVIPEQQYVMECGIAQMVVMKSIVQGRLEIFWHGTCLVVRKINTTAGILLQKGQALQTLLSDLIVYPWIERAMELLIVSAQLMNVWAIVTRAIRGSMIWCQRWNLVNFDSDVQIQTVVFALVGSVIEAKAVTRTVRMKAYALGYMMSKKRTNIDRQHLDVDPIIFSARMEGVWPRACVAMVISNVIQMVKMNGSVI